MSSAPTPVQQLTPSERHSSVIMGSQGFISVLLRSTAGELYKIRRRLMSKILLIIGISLMFILFGFLLLGYVFISAASSTTCSPNQEGQMVCEEQAPNSPQAQQAKRAMSASLRLPDSFATAIGMVNQVGLILLIVLTGTIVGGEYGVGTIRLMLTRGPTRLQFLLAKMLTILLCILIALAILVPLGIIAGALFNLATEFGGNTNFLTGEWIIHAALYLLITILGLFIYNMIALCLATLGRSTAAGIAGALIWWFLEGIITTILRTVASTNRDTLLGDITGAIPNYFIGNTFSALLTHQSRYMAGQDINQNSANALLMGDVSDTHALIVLCVYLVLFTGVAWLVTQKRDITN